MSDKSIGDKSEEFDVKTLYTPLLLAKTEILERWNNKDLRQKTSSFLKGDVPEIFRDKPKAIIFRNIATPNMELQAACEYARMMNLELVVIEYTADRFCTRNRDKLHLGKMIFVNNKDRTKPVSKENIISIKEDDNKCFFEIKTLWGENLVSFHHRILKECGPIAIDTFDASIYKNIGLSPYEIYLKILGICVCSGVLLENFLVKTDPGEKKFTENVIYPAFAEIEKIFGFRPMIVPLFSADEDEDIVWQYYSEKVRAYSKL